MEIEHLALNFMEGIGLLSAQRLLKIFGSAKNFFEADKTAWRQAKVREEICKKQKSFIAAAMSKAERDMEECRKRGIWIVGCQDEEYPRALKMCMDAPLQLYGLGNPKVDFSDSVAFVGTRHASFYGKSQTRTTIEELAPHLSATVSGLAIGIDTEAHQSSLDCNVPTVAVIGCGLDHIYPPCNRNLSQRIIDNGGAIISEMTCQTNVIPGIFPRRNRIIAGLTQITVIAESAVKGGAMHTACSAESYQRMVFAVPGRNDQYYYEGCNLLISSGRAQLLRRPEDIKYAMGWIVPEKSGNPPKSGAVQACLDFSEPTTKRKPLQDREQEKIMRILDMESPAGLELLMLRSGMSPQILSNCLLNMEIAGLIKTQPGNFYEKMQ